MSKISIQLVQDKFNDFLKILEDLSDIGDTIKLKIDNDNILMYSSIGDPILVAFKSYLINTSEFLLMKKDLESKLDIIITGAKKFTKNLSFIKTSEKIIMEVNCREDVENDMLVSRFIDIKNDKLKIGLQCGESSEIRNITKEILSKHLDIKNKKWSFKISNQDFGDIKKLSRVNSEGKVINLNIYGGKIVLSEPSIWELHVDDIEFQDKHLIFNKSFLSSIDDSLDEIFFYVFETFMLIRDDQSNLMISFEHTLED